MQKDPGDKTAFLIGAGRSGTTLLYKLLCLHPGVAYISNYDERLPWLPPGSAAGLASHRIGAKLKAWFNHGGNAYFISRPWLKRAFPTPVEGEAIYRSCGMPLFPCADYLPSTDTRAHLRDRFAATRRRMNADIMLSKRTANNRRIPALEAVFRGAKYIHVIRDGRDVADSLSRVEWWDDHVLWWDGRTAAQAEQDGEARLAIAARNWTHELREIHRGLAVTPGERVFEVRYEDVLADPGEWIGAIRDFLGLPEHRGFSEAISSLNLHYSPGHWASRWSAEQLETVMREVQPTLRDLGYVWNRKRGAR